MRGDQAAGSQRPSSFLARLRADREPLIFGVADGLTSAVGLTVGLAATGHLDAAWVTGFSGGIAAFPGMASGKYQSDPAAGKAAAVTCGLATTAGSVLPALPFLAGHGPAELSASFAVACVLCALVAVLRPESGLKGLVLSYGITAAAAALSAAFGLALGS